jgi:fructokinase
MTAPKTILALGEVLWDIFPDGPLFGGAPANFACACAGLGMPYARALLASAVGNDKLGDEARQRLVQHGVDVSHVATSPHLTGQVLINLDPAGRASYRFLESTAWDHVPLTPALLDAAKKADGIHFGTLGQRADVSRATIRSLVEATTPQCLRILDINLRAPHWSKEVVLESLALANVLKLNDEELPALASVLGLSGTENEILATLQARYQLRLVALTRGENGSMLLGPRGERNEQPSAKVKVVDTVGAGDAFTAAVALGLSHGHKLDRIHPWASEVAGFVCTQPGATPGFPAHLKFRP